MKPPRSRCWRPTARVRHRRLGAAVSRRRRRRARRPLPESRRLGGHSDVALLFAVFLAEAGCRSVAADLDLSRSLLPDDGVSADGAGRAAAQPVNNTYVVHISRPHRRDGPPVSARSSNRWQYAQSEEAKAAASQRGAGFEAVGLTPWQPAFSVPAITGLQVVAGISRAESEGERDADGQDLRGRPLTGWRKCIARKHGNSETQNFFELG